MNPRPPANVPTSLARARRQLDQWRGRQPGRKRLPRELWSNAVALAREYGINKTARTLGLKYESLQKHLEAAPPRVSGLETAGTAFIELVPGTMVPSPLECTIEWEQGTDGKMRMHVKGASLVDLASFVRRLRDNRA